jgi:hypothetical protein
MILLISSYPKRHYIAAGKVMYNLVNQGVKIKQ